MTAEKEKEKRISKEINTSKSDFNPEKKRLLKRPKK